MWIINKNKRNGDILIIAQRFATGHKRIDPKVTIYMGKDKFENEELLKYSFPNDVWFHVCSFSSAHIYLRLPEDIDDLANIPKEILEECAQITKWNSIEGSKRGSVKIVYTFAKNLRKEKTMATGEVSFHEESQCRYMNVSTNKKLYFRPSTTIEMYEEKMKDLEHQEKERKKLEEHMKKEEEKEAKVKALKEKEEEKVKSYAYMMKRDEMTSNKEIPQDEDFW